MVRMIGMHYHSLFLNPCMTGSTHSLTFLPWLAWAPQPLGCYGDWDTEHLLLSLQLQACRSPRSLSHRTDSFGLSLDISFYFLHSESLPWLADGRTHQFRCVEQSTNENSGNAGGECHSITARSYWLWRAILQRLYHNFLKTKQNKFIFVLWALVFSVCVCLYDSVGILDRDLRNLLGISFLSIECIVRTTLLCGTLVWWEEQTQFWGQPRQRWMRSVRMLVLFCLPETEDLKAVMHTLAWARASP